MSRNKQGNYKGLKVSKTPVSHLPKPMRDKLRKAMLMFIRDTHNGLANINPNIKTMGVEASLECIEELHEQGYMIFERDESNKRYGFKVMLYDDESGVYDDMTRIYKQLKNREEEKDYEY